MLAFFSVHLKQLREAKKLTQTQVANYVGVSRSVISAYENDMRYPSYEILIRLSTLFGVSTDYLLGIEDRRYLDISELSDQEAALLYGLLSADSQAECDKIAVDCYNDLYGSPYQKIVSALAGA